MAALVVACSAAGPGLHVPQVPYVATPDDIALEMLTLAGVTERDEVWDLGSGDGRLVILAAQRFGARGVGVELDGGLVQDSRDSAARAGVADRTAFLWRDLFDVELRPATVVTLYLLPEVNLRLRPRLLAQLAPGARVVSHRFDMGDWPPDRELRFLSPGRDHRLLLWIVPARIDGAWTLTVDTPTGTRRYRARFTQRFQRFAGTLDDGETSLVVEDGQLRGRDISFMALGPAGGGAFAGTVEGDVARGTVGSDGGRWIAHRSGATPWPAQAEGVDRLSRRDSPARFTPVAGPPPSQNETP
jgi:hypothetical protein